MFIGQQCCQWNVETTSWPRHCHQSSRSVESGSDEPLDKDVAATRDLGMSLPLWELANTMHLRIAIPSTKPGTDHIANEALQVIRYCILQITWLTDNLDGLLWFIMLIRYQSNILWTNMDHINHTYSTCVDPVDQWQVLAWSQPSLPLVASWSCQKPPLSFRSTGEASSYQSGNSGLGSLKNWGHGMSWVFNWSPRYGDHVILRALRMRWEPMWPMVMPCCWNSGHVGGRSSPSHVPIAEIPTFVSSSPIPKITIPNTARNRMDKHSKMGWTEHCHRVICWVPIWCSGALL